VLFRLGDLEATKRELALLEGRGLSNSQESDRLKYLARASKDTQSVRLKGRYSFGVRHDSNVNRASPIAAQLDGVGVFEDEAAVATLQLRAEVDLNNGQGDYLFVQGDALATEYFDLNSADLLSGQLKVGAALHLKDFLFTPYGTYDATVLRDEKFRERLGGGLDSQWSVTPQSTFFLDGSVFYEDYSTTSFSTVGSLRDGWLYSLRGGYKVRPTDWQHLTFESQFAVKDAKNSGHDYDELQFRIRSLTLLGEGRYLSLSGGYTRTEYDQADGVTSANFAREDDRYDAKMLLGLPMEYILGGVGLTTPKPLEGYVAQGGASWISQHSSIDRLDFENWSGELMFAKRFAF
jgi:hypothetical protein